MLICYRLCSSFLHLIIRYVDRLEKSLDTFKTFQCQLRRTTFKNFFFKERALSIGLHVPKAGGKPLETALQNQN